MALTSEERQKALEHCKKYHGNASLAAKEGGICSKNVYRELWNEEIPGEAERYGIEWERQQETDKYERIRDAYNILMEQEMELTLNNLHHEVEFDYSEREIGLVLKRLGLKLHSSGRMRTKKQWRGVNSVLGQRKIGSNGRKSTRDRFS